VPVCDAVLVRLPVALELGVPVCDAVPLRLPVALELGVPVCDAVLVRLPVALVLGVPVCDAVLVRLPVALELGVPVCDAVLVRLPVALELGVPVCVVVLLLLRLDVGEPDRVISDAKLTAPRIGTSQLSKTDSEIPPFQPFEGINDETFEISTHMALCMRSGGILPAPAERSRYACFTCA